jgi:ribosomal protein S12 methylthiotransferase accessory factor YcaO
MKPLVRLTLWGAAPALALLVACASSPPALVVPANLAAPAGERKAFEHFARGVQIYRCTAGAAAGAAPSWAFVAPQAELFASAASNTVLGTHGAGPFWQANDGSRVQGQVKARADAPAAGAIPWLLLATTPNAVPGLMAPVSSIQRVSTVAGVAPAQGCAAAVDVGKEARVPYTAVYVYFVKA